MRLVYVMNIASKLNLIEKKMAVENEAFEILFDSYSRDNDLYRDQRRPRCILKLPKTASK